MEKAFTNPHFAMKIIMQLACIVCLATAPVQATPSRTTTIRETFLGSNATGYAILRTESDNLGSYYKEHRTTWLDEYQKDAQKDTKPRSTQLLDQTHFTDPADTTRKSTTEHSKDAKTTLADIIDRYPQMVLVPWPLEQTKELHFDKNTGSTEYKSQCLIAAKTLLGSRFGHEDPGATLELLAVAEDSNCIFLTIATDNDEGQESRIICIPAAITRNIHALKNLEPLYLSAGSFDSEKEALALVRKMQANAGNSYGPAPMVWSVFHSDTGKTDYAVVLANSADLIKRNEFGAKQQDLFGMHMVPITSEGFRTLVTNPPR
jgi:hypothetical protein